MDFITVCIQQIVGTYVVNINSVPFCYSDLLISNQTIIDIVALLPNVTTILYYHS
jgi:transcriptional regulatory protein LevR